MMTYGNLDLLACPGERVLVRFVQEPHGMDRLALRAVSKHLGRCPECRETADRFRRSDEATRERRPWLWAGLGMACLAGASALLVAYEISSVVPARLPDGAFRPNPHVAALAWFEPPGAIDAASLSGAGAALPDEEDARQTNLAIASLREGRFGDAARLLEDLTARHPARRELRLYLAWAQSRAGDYERARASYSEADDGGTDPRACRGLVNVSLRLGDIVTARRELTAHLLALHPEDAEARRLLRGLVGATGVPMLP